MTTRIRIRPRLPAWAPPIPALEGVPTPVSHVWETTLLPGFTPMPLRETLLPSTTPSVRVTQARSSGKAGEGVRTTSGWAGRPRTTFASPLLDLDGTDGRPTMPAWMATASTATTRGVVTQAPEALRLTDSHAGALAAAMIRQSFEQVARMSGAARVEAWLWLFTPFSTRLHEGVGMSVRESRAWAWERGVRLRGSGGANFSEEQTIYTTSAPFKTLPELAGLTPGGPSGASIGEADYDPWADWLLPHLRAFARMDLAGLYSASKDAGAHGLPILSRALRQIARTGIPRPYPKGTLSTADPQRKRPVGASEADWLGHVTGH